MCKRGVTLWSVVCGGERKLLGDWLPSSHLWAPFHGPQPGLALVTQRVKQTTLARRRVVTRGGKELGMGHLGHFMFPTALCLKDYWDLSTDNFLQGIIPASENILPKTKTNFNSN